MAKMSQEQRRRLSYQNTEYVKVRNEIKKQRKGTIASQNQNAQFKETLKNTIIDQGISVQQSEDPENYEEWDKLGEDMKQRVENLHGRMVEEFSRNYEYLIDDVFRYRYNKETDMEELDWTDAQQKMLNLASQLGIRYNRYFNDEETKQRNLNNSIEYMTNQKTMYGQYNEGKMFSQYRDDS